MKKLICSLLVVCLLTGCSSGVSQEEYDKVVSERDELQSELDETKSYRNNLVAKYDRLYSENEELKKAMSQPDDDDEEESTSASSKNKNQVSQDSKENSTQSESTTESPEVLITLINETLKKSFGNNVEVSYDAESKTIVASVWADGVAAGVLLAVSGDAETLSTWNDMKNNMASLSKTMKSTIESAGYDDMNILLNVLNDQNKDSVLLSMLNGAIVYNAVS